MGASIALDQGSANPQEGSQFRVVDQTTPVIYTERNPWKKETSPAARVTSYGLLSSRWTELSTADRTDERVMIAPMQPGDSETRTRACGPLGRLVDRDPSGQRVKRGSCGRYENHDPNRVSRRFAARWAVQRIVTHRVNKWNAAPEAATWFRTLRGQHMHLRALASLQGCIIGPPQRWGGPIPHCRSRAGHGVPALLHWSFPWLISFLAQMTALSDAPRWFVRP